MSEPSEREAPGYLPVDCPNCGRHRLLYSLQSTADGVMFVSIVHCEKCEMEDPEFSGHAIRAEVVKRIREYLRDGGDICETDTMLLLELLDEIEKEGT